MDYLLKVEYWVYTPLPFELTGVIVHQLCESGEVVALVDVEPAVVALMDSVVLYIVLNVSILPHGEWEGTYNQGNAFVKVKATVCVLYILEPLSLSTWNLLW